jgi:choline dehydrogenase
VANARSLDYMAYTRGSREDFDRMARVSGDKGWSWDSLIPYMRKVPSFDLDPELF